MRYFLYSQFFLNWQIGWQFWLTTTCFFSNDGHSTSHYCRTTGHWSLMSPYEYAKWWKGHYDVVDASHQIPTTTRVRSIVGDILTPKRIFSSVTGNIRIIIDIHAPKEGHYTSVVSHSRLKWFQIIRYEILVRCLLKLEFRRLLRRG